jgi:chemotaxis protein MotA
VEIHGAVQSRFVDKSTIFGMLTAFSFIGFAIYMGGNAHGFIDSRSILIVIFGTFAVIIACFSFAEVKSALIAMVHTVVYRSEGVEKAAAKAVEISDVARKKGFLELDNYAHLTRHNPFLREGVNMIVDSVKPEDIEKLLNNELESMVYRHTKSVSVLRKAAEVSPSMGLIGTLIGLVQMLSNLEDASSIGPSMAVALLTTFYGAMLSYMFFAPIASKLERNTKEEVLVAKVYIQAIKSIVNKESPRKLETTLNSILPPTKRLNYFAIKNRKSPKKESEQE